MISSTKSLTLLFLSFPLLSFASQGIQSLGALAKGDRNIYFVGAYDAPINQLNPQLEAEKKLVSIFLEELAKEKEETAVFSFLNKETCLKIYQSYLQNTKSGLFMTMSIPTMVSSLAFTKNFRAESVSFHFTDSEPLEGAIESCYQIFATDILGMLFSKLNVPYGGLQEFESKLKNDPAFRKSFFGPAAHFSKLSKVILESTKRDLPQMKTQGKKYIRITKDYLTAIESMIKEVELLRERYQQEPSQLLMIDEALKSMTNAQQKAISFSDNMVIIMTP